MTATLIGVAMDAAAAVAAQPRPLRAPEEMALAKHVAL
jgi:hypothetical protein